MDTTTSAGRAFLQIQAAFAEMEGNVIGQRVREGTIAARARGRKKGRSRIMTPEKRRYAQSLMADPTRSIPEISREVGDLPPSRAALPVPLCQRNAHGSGPAAACRVRSHHGRRPVTAPGGVTPMTHRDPPGAETAGTLALLPSDAARTTTRVLGVQTIETADFRPRRLRAPSPHSSPHLLLEHPDAAHCARAIRRIPHRMRVRLLACGEQRGFHHRAPDRSHGRREWEWPHERGGDRMHIETRQGSKRVRRLPLSAVYCHVSTA